MTYTSAEAGKLLKRLNEELKFQREQEQAVATFEAAVGENLEDVRPKYDFAESRRKQQDLENKIRKVKHTLAIFNTTTKVEGTEMTIDEVLVYIPQLTAEKETLNELRSQLPKSRVKDAYGRVQSTLITYRYANYDVEEARKAYNKVSSELADLQNALDVTNAHKTLEIDVEFDS